LRTVTFRLPSSSRLQRETFREDEHSLLVALSETTSPEVMQKLLTEILTPAEYASLCRRWSILRQIHAGRTQRAIAADLHASLCNITRGARILRSEQSVAAQILCRTPGSASAAEPTNPARQP
jgi:Trp operon repressor